MLQRIRLFDIRYASIFNAENVCILKIGFCYPTLFYFKESIKVLSDL